jgi:hypothetical protein
MSQHVLDCPKCSKKALVERRNDLYQCLSCDFKRDLDESKANKSTNDGDFVWIVFMALAIVLLLQGLSFESTIAPNQPFSPTTESMPNVNPMP